MGNLGVLLQSLLGMNFECAQQRWLKCGAQRGGGRLKGNFVDLGDGLDRLPEVAGRHRYSEQ